MLGYGLGVGTNVGAKLITGEIQFMLSEGEVGRMLMEMGPIFGIAFIGWRFLLGLHLARQSFGCTRQGNLLPMMLLSACVLNLTVGQIAQPTNLGFTALGCGLCLAAIRATGSAPPAEDELTQRERQKLERLRYFRKGQSRQRGQSRGGSG
jgi:hypothetical protein